MYVRRRLCGVSPSGRRASCCFSSRSFARSTERANVRFRTLFRFCGFAVVAGNTRSVGAVNWLEAR